jgi:hypothetical protein
MFWAEEAAIWVLAALALVGYLAVITLLTRSAIVEWRSIRGIGISARIPGSASQRDAGNQAALDPWAGRQTLDQSRASTTIAGGPPLASRDRAAPDRPRRAA